MKCKYYAISKEEIIKRLEKWDGVAYLSGYSSHCTLLNHKRIQALRKNLADFAPTKKFSPDYVSFLSGDVNVKALGELKRSHAIRNGRDKMHTKSVTSMRWLYESFVNETFPHSPYWRDAMEYVRGVADSGVVMDPFLLMDRVREYLAKIEEFKNAPK